MSTRQRTLEGKVLRSGGKTAMVSVSRSYRHPIGKTCTSTRKYMVHDENNETTVGDIVQIGEVRPISKRKSWSLLKVLSKAAGVQS